MNRCSLRDYWLSWVDQVLPADAPAVQREECYRAFMSGAAAARRLSSEGVNTSSEIRAFFDACDKTRFGGFVEPKGGAR